MRGTKFHTRRLAKLYKRKNKLREVREQLAKGLIEPRPRKPFTRRK